MKCFLLLSFSDSHNPSLSLLMSEPNYTEFGTSHSLFPSREMIEEQHHHNQQCSPSQPGFYIESQAGPMNIYLQFKKTLNITA